MTFSYKYFVRCRKVLKRNASSNTTSNLLSHQRECSPKSDLRPQQGLMWSFASGSTYKREKLRALTTLWVTWRRHPFQIAQDPKFHEIIHLLNPLAHTHSGMTQARNIKCLYKLSREKTRIFLAVCQYSYIIQWLNLFKSTIGVIHVALDLWTDLNMVPWLGVICYLVHCSKYKQFVLDFIRWVSSRNWMLHAKGLIALAKATLE
jgi:hypothetical protein